MTRAAKVAAALERYQSAKEKWRATGGREWSDMEIAADALARLLRESQPEPAARAVGEDEALLERWNRVFLTVQGSDPDKCRDLTRVGEALATRLRAALADLARVEARPSRYEDLMAIEQLQVQVDHYRTGMIESRAALADVARLTEENAALKTNVVFWVNQSRIRDEMLHAARAAAVAEEREALLDFIGKEKRQSASGSDYWNALDSVSVFVRARAGRNDG